MRSENGPFGDEAKLYVAGSEQRHNRDERGWIALDLDVLSALEIIPAWRADVMDWDGLTGRNKNQTGLFILQKWLVLAM